MFTIALSTFEELENDRIRFTIRIPDGYRDSPQFFRLNTGAFRANPRILNQADASVECEISPRKAVYLIDPPPSLTLWARFVRAFRMVFAATFPFEIRSLRRSRSAVSSLTTNFLLATEISPCRFDPTGQESVFVEKRNSWI